MKLNQNGSAIVWALVTMGIVTSVTAVILNEALSVDKTALVPRARSYASRKELEVRSILSQQWAYGNSADHVVLDTPTLFGNMNANQPAWFNCAANDNECGIRASVADVPPVAPATQSTRVKYTITARIGSRYAGKDIEGYLDKPFQMAIANSTVGCNAAAPVMAGLDENGEAICKALPVVSPTARAYPKPAPNRCGPGTFLSGINPVLSDSPADNLSWCKPYSADSRSIAAVPATSNVLSCYQDANDPSRDKIIGKIDWNQQSGLTVSSCLDKLDPLTGFNRSVASLPYNPSPPSTYKLTVRTTSSCQNVISDPVRRVAPAGPNQTILVGCFNGKDNPAAAPAGCSNDALTQAFQTSMDRPSGEILPIGYTPVVADGGIPGTPDVYVANGIYARTSVTDAAIDAQPPGTKIPWPANNYVMVTMDSDKTVTYRCPSSSTLVCTAAQTAAGWGIVNGVCTAPCGVLGGKTRNPSCNPTESPIAGSFYSATAGDVCCMPCDSALGPNCARPLTCVGDDSIIPGPPSLPVPYIRLPADERALQPKELFRVYKREFIITRSEWISIPLFFDHTVEDGGCSGLGIANVTVTIRNKGTGWFQNITRSVQKNDPQTPIITLQVEPGRYEISSLSVNAPQRTGAICANAYYGDAACIP